jgi:hypothetical protein
MSKLSSALSILVLLFSATALAQPEKQPEKPDKDKSAEDKAMEEAIAGEGEPAEPEEEPVVFDSDAGADENPGDPNSVFAEQNKPKDESKETVEEAQTGYPIQLIHRPINLPGGMSQVSLGIPFQRVPASTMPNADIVTSIGAYVQAAYAVNSKVQLGLQYGFGSLTDGEFNVGKAVAVGGQYLITNWVGASATIPIYLDPRAFGINLGAPMWFTFFDKFSLRFGEDLLSFRVYKFLPSISDAFQNEKNAEDTRPGENQIVPLWYLNIGGRFIYQLQDNIAVDMHFAAVNNDVSGSKTVWPLDFGFTYSTSNKLDFGARLGFLQLADGFDSFGGSLFATLRI